MKTGEGRKWRDSFDPSKRPLAGKPAAGRRGRRPTGRPDRHAHQRQQLCPHKTRRRLPRRHGKGGRRSSELRRLRRSKPLLLLLQGDEERARTGQRSSDRQAPGPDEVPADAPFHADRRRGPRPVRRQRHYGLGCAANSAAPVSVSSWTNTTAKLPPTVWRPYYGKSPHRHTKRLPQESEEQHHLHSGGRGSIPLRRTTQTDSTVTGRLGQSRRLSA